MNTKLENIIGSITPANVNVANIAQKKLDLLTKPQGSLGVLEECAIKYVAARQDIFAEIAKPTILTFAGDHGVVEENVSACPQEVTLQMLSNFSNGGAAINVLTRQFGIDLKVIDVGVASECKHISKITHKKVALGTANIAKGPAMTIEEAESAIFAGIDEVEKVIADGATLIGTGDMGIGNTTPSTALYSVFTKSLPVEITGCGTGISEETLKHKVSVIEKAIKINNEKLTDPLNTLAALGGLEIAGICGAILGAAKNKIPIVIDGFISGAAAITAFQFNENVKDYCFFSHLSAESGHINIMKKLNITPLLDLKLRLGEGTGAALAMNIIQAGVKTMNEMATFSEAGIDNHNE